MSWEFRIFVRLSSISILSSIINQVFPIFAHDVKAKAGQGRTDIYLLLEHCNEISCGIKVRGGSTTEVKLCKGVVPNTYSSLEKWKKTTNVSKLNRTSKKWHDEVGSFLHQTGALPVGENVRVTNLIYIRKNREKARYQNVTATLDVLQVKHKRINRENTVKEETMSDGDDGDDGGSVAEQWISFSLEGDCVNCQMSMNALNCMSVLDQVKEKVVFGGYPCFAKYISDQQHHQYRGLGWEDGDDQNSSNAQKGEKKQQDT